VIPPPFKPALEVDGRALALPHAIPLIHPLELGFVVVLVVVFALEAVALGLGRSWTAECDSRVDGSTDE